MDIFLIILGFLLLLLGLLGSFLPVLPGPPLSWLGLVLLYLTKAVPMDWWMLGITLFIALAVLALDYIIPAMGTRRFGGSRGGVIGTMAGVIVAVVAFPVFNIFGIVLWPFLGALAGELINKTNSRKAVRAAFGSVMGFLAGTFLKFILAIAYLVIFISKIWSYREVIFSF